MKRKNRYGKSISERKLHRKENRKIQKSKKKNDTTEEIVKHTSVCVLEEIISSSSVQDSSSFECIKTQFESGLLSSESSSIQKIDDEYKYDNRSELQWKKTSWKTNLKN